MSLSVERELPVHEARAHLAHAAHRFGTPDELPSNGMSAVRQGALSAPTEQEVNGKRYLTPSRTPLRSAYRVCSGSCEAARREWIRSTRQIFEREGVVFWHPKGARWRSLVGLASETARHIIPQRAESKGARLIPEFHPWFTYTHGPGNGPWLKTAGYVVAPHQFFHVFQQIFASREVASLLEAGWGRRCGFLTHSKLTYKVPGQKGMKWAVHQDNAYRRNKGPTVGVMLEDVCSHNGALRHTPGSHRLPLLPHEKIQHGQLRVREGKIPHGLQPDRIACAPRATLSMHHGNTLHTSTASFEPRRSNASWRTYFLFDVRECRESYVDSFSSSDTRLTSDERGFLRPCTIDGNRTIPNKARRTFDTPASL